MRKNTILMLEEVLNTPAFGLHLAMLCQMSDGIFRIPIWLGDNLPSFEYSREIALTASLRKARRGRDSSSLS